MSQSPSITLCGVLLATCVGMACVGPSSSPPEDDVPPATRSQLGPLVLHTPHLVKDVATGASAPSLSPYMPSRRGFVTLGPLTFFTAMNQFNDIEVWKSDGTLEGTSPLRDLVPGPWPSHPGNYTVMGGALYFTSRTADLLDTVALWRTDGTPEGTHIVSMLNDRPAFVTARGTTLYVMANGNGGEDGFTLWKTDGTTSGLTQVYAHRTRSSYAYPNAPGFQSAFAWMGDTLFFIASTPPLGSEVWRSDGTTAGTRMVVNAFPDDGARGPGAFDVVASGDLVYFKTPGIEDDRLLLWRTDGTPEGTFSVLHLQSPSDTPHDARPVDVSGRLFFARWDAQTGPELWSTDGSLAGTSRVVTLDADTKQALPRDLVSSQGLLWFTTQDVEQREQVFVSDGTAGGTHQVTGLVSGDPASSRVVGASPHGVYFARSTPAETSVWTTDGTGEGTRKLLVPPPLASSLDYHPTGEGHLFISRPEGYLWSTDGTPEGTTSLGVTQFPVNGVGELTGINLGGRFVFPLPSSVDPTQPFGDLLWGSDGTPEGTGRLATPPLSRSTAQVSLGIVGGQGFVWRYISAVLEPGVLVSELVRLDGSPDGTEVLKTVRLPPHTYDVFHPPPAIAFQQQVFFVNPQTPFWPGPSTLWKSDGTPEGTVAVTPLLDHESQSVFPRLFASTGERFFFVAGASPARESLWVSDGSAEGTRPVHEFAVTASTNSSLRPVLHLLPLGRQVLVWTETQEEGPTLWVSDGTPEGTRLLRTFEGPGPHLAQGPETTAVVGAQCFFITQAGGAPAQLWKTDGRSATVVATFQAFTPEATPTHLTPLRGAVWFWANDAAHGYELWTSDGTTEGTRLVKDIAPGPESATGRPGPLVSLGPDGPLVFAASDGPSGEELWQTDGTAEGTVRVADIAPGPLSSSPSHFFTAGRQVFFLAWTPESGRELWALERPVQDITPPVLTCPPSQVVEATGPFGQRVRHPRATATDEGGSEPLVRYSSYWGTIFPLGTTEVRVTAADDVGNRATCAFDVTVRDTRPPSLSCPANQRLVADDDQHATATWPTLDARDVVTDVVLETSVAQGTRLPVGTHSVTVTARDLHGNTERCTFSVVVVKSGGGGCQQAGDTRPLGLGLALFTLWWMKPRRRRGAGSIP
ncbi:HYR domain-containing protein [Myxococcus sp. K15C18031901]|uniref:ELWxxDGT repeat protein n=1 Tax=Myxococcus dinghuensis TaxID=2906761 RepID=UPI0020A8223A|nr:ELWxxDGT repeat protein [Myxococcus dinghuensis]MCP3102987.1 HYR domain-containing protein [Myxococcus dinghuensis]